MKETLEILFALITAGLLFWFAVRIWQYPPYQQPEVPILNNLTLAESRDLADLLVRSGSVGTRHRRRERLAELLAKTGLTEAEAYKDLFGN